jgi:hypothetical protein
MKKSIMDTLVGFAVVGFIFLLIFLPLVYFTRRSSDIRLLGDKLEIHYPMRHKEIQLKQELKSWNLQHATFLWIGKVYSINIELLSGKWHHVNTRFNRESFDRIYEYLTANYIERKKIIKR